MFEALIAWATTHPLGIGITTGLAVTLLTALSAAIWKPFRMWLARGLRRLRHLRLTTEPRQSDRAPLPPARWFLRPTREAGSWALINHGSGDAFSVQIDSSDGASMVLGSGFWTEVLANHAVGVRLRPAGRGFDDESTFRITWRDSRKVGWEVHVEAFPVERYTSTDKIPPIPSGTTVYVRPE
jgi:hypothetical protein